MPADTRVDVYLPLYVRDFLTSTIGWTAEERGHYLTLLMIQWDRGSLPAEATDLERLSPGVCQCWSVLAGKFPVCDDGTRRNAKLEEHRCRCVEIREKRSQAGKSAASGRWSGDASRIANAQQTHSKRIANACHPTSTSTSTSDTGSSASAEELQPAAPVVATSDPPKRRKRSQPQAAGVRWDSESGWQGITEADRQEWATAFPGAVLDQELAKATAWLRANPERAGKRKWRAFLVRWLGRCQDKGGTNREPGKRPDEKPPPKRWLDEYRPAPYRRPAEAEALATTLKLKDENP